MASNNPGFCSKAYMRITLFPLAFNSLYFAGYFAPFQTALYGPNASDRLKRLLVGFGADQLQPNLNLTDGSRPDFSHAALLSFSPLVSNPRRSPMTLQATPITIWLTSASPNSLFKTGYVQFERALAKVARIRGPGHLSLHTHRGRPLHASNTPRSTAKWVRCYLLSAPNGMQPRLPVNSCAK
ncbi:hypothetical protein FKP32DRAFT_479305 [Trametes sanguinea]|nr:hypothetical protein FKP32DRAFT_479305 [Trametes sanguinea]